MYECNGSLALRAPGSTNNTDRIYLWWEKAGCRAWSIPEHDLCGADTPLMWTVLDGKAGNVVSEDEISEEMWIL